MKQLLVEASVRAVAAGTIGVMIAIWGTRTLVAFSPPDVPRLDEVAVNGSVLLFTLALCVVVSLLFGLPPALPAAGTDVNAPLRHSAGRPERHKIPSARVCSESRHPNGSSRFSTALRVNDREPGASI